MGSSMVFQPPRATPIPEWMKNQIYYINKSKAEDPEKFFPMLPGFCCSDRKIMRKVPYLHLSQTIFEKQSKYLIIYFHGTSELLSDIYRTLEKYHANFEVINSHFLSSSLTIDGRNLPRISWLWYIFKGKTL